MYFLEGNVGTGKSTFLKELENEGLGVIYEPVKQWENMKKSEIVEGNKKNGVMTENFSYVTLFSINAPFDSIGDSIKLYTQRGDTGVPTTVILYEQNGTVYWYGFSGDANGKGGRPNIDGLVFILERAKEAKNGFLQF